MSNQDLGAQLNLANQLREALTGVAAVYEKLGKTMGSQTQTTNELADAMGKIADGKGKKKINEMDEALEALGKSLGKSGKGLSNFKKMAPVAFLAAANGPKKFRQVLGGTFNMVGSLTSSIFSLAKGAIGALIGSYEGLIGMALNAAGGMDAVAQATENLRGQFGDLASNEGKAVMGAIGNLRSEFSKTAGMSLGRVFGPGAEGMAAAMAAMGEMAGELGARLNLLMDDVAENAAVMMTLNRGFNLSAEAMGNMALMARQSGGDMQSALEETAVQVAVLSKQFGVSGKVIGKNLSELTADMGTFGHMSQAELTATATYAAKLGVEIQSLKGMFDKFANFEDAATGAAKLAETFGMNVDAMELMNAESPAEQMDMMRQAFMETGRSLDDLSRQEKAYLAEQMNVDPNDLYAMFDPANADLSFDEIAEEAENAAEKMSPEEAMAEAAKGIEKSIQSAMKEVKGFIDAFVKGFMYALKFTEPFVKATQSIRQALREVFNIGGELARGLFDKGGAFHPQSMHGVSLLQKILGHRGDPKSVVGIFVVLKDSIIALAKGEMTFSGLIKKMKDTLVDFVQSDHFQELGGYLLDGLEKAIGFVLESATDLINMLASGISEPFTGIDIFGDAESPINKSLSNIFETISNNMGPLKEAIGNLVSSIIGAIVDFLIENPKVLMGALAVLFGPAVIGAALSSMTTMIVGYIGTTLVPAFLSAFTASLSGGGGLIVAVKAGFGAVGAILKPLIVGTLFPLIKVIGLIVAAVMVGKAAFESITQVFSRLTEKFEKSGSVLELLIGYFTEVFFIIPRLLANLIDLIAGFFGFETDVVGAVNTTVDFITEAFLGFFTALPQMINDFFFGLKDMIVRFGSALAEGFSSAYNTVVDFVKNIGTKIGDIAVSVGTTIFNVAKYFSPLYWASLAADAVSGFMGSFDIVGKIKEKIKEMFPMVAKLMGIQSPSTVFAEFGQAATDGMAQGAAGMSDAIKGPTQKNLDKIAGDMNKLDTSKINEASGKFMDLEQVSDSLNNVNAGLKELETGVSSKKLGEAAKEMPLAIKELMKMGESILAFGAEKGQETISKMNGSLHFFADRIPQIATKIKTIADSLNEMTASLETLVSTSMGDGKVDKVVKVLGGIFGTKEGGEGALIPEMSQALDDVGAKKLDDLLASVQEYEPKVKGLATNTVSLAESMETMLDAVEKMSGVIPERATGVKAAVEAVVAKMTEVNAAIAGLEAAEVTTKLQQVAEGLSSDGTVTVQYEQMQLNVNFTVQIDAKDIASAVGEDAKGGSYFVINEQRGGGGGGGEGG